MSIKSFYPGDIPPSPGVYVFRDKFGTVIYVGKASNLRKRVSSYFQASRKSSNDPKQRSLIKSIDTWEFYTVKNEDESLLLESRLIKQYSPKYNILMRDDKRYLLVKINLNEKYPKLTLARLRKDDNSRYFGPFPKGGVLKATIEYLRRHFGIRACHALVPGEKEHKHCLASIVKDCCAICIGGVTGQEYRGRIEALMEVLDGNIKPIIEELEEKMTKYSSSKQFERAAKWRDIIANIKEVFGARNRSFRFATIPSFFNEEAVVDLHKALGIQKQPRVIEGFDISNISGKLAVASMVCFKDGKPDRKNYRRFKIREVHQIDDFAMMSEVITRHYTKKMAEKRPLPDLILIDGGKGQLNSALKALVKIGCPPLPIIGLAKKHEEIFIPGKDSPIILDKTRPALKLLQALRDEAHRFAITYHHKLRSKKIQESILDEIPGIGSSRKVAILKEFGSLRELRKATPVEISDRVTGIGLKFAEIIYNYLKKK